MQRQYSIRVTSTKDAALIQQPLTLGLRQGLAIKVDSCTSISKAHILFLEMKTRRTAPSVQ